jgi:hypothetical protein
MKAVSFVLTLMLLFVFPANIANATNRLEKSIATVLANPAYAKFFAREARKAGVSAIRARKGRGPYGRTEYNSGTRRSVITIYVDVRGAKSPTNLAHEIAHASAMRRGCYNHGRRWLKDHMAIAQRFEQVFPGVLWSGRSPTENVAGKAARYPNDRC